MPERLHRVDVHGADEDAEHRRAEEARDADRQPSDPQSCWPEGDGAQAFACLGDCHQAAFFMSLSAAATVRRKSTTRGPHREAMSSSSAKTLPDLTASMLLQPGRFATVVADCWQHFVSARKIRSGSDWMIDSGDSCG